AVTADLAFAGWAFDFSANVPQWDSTMRVTGQDMATTPSGRFTLHTALQPAISRGLGLTVRDGELNATGQWRAGGQPTLSGRVQIDNTNLGWGGVTAQA